MIDRALFFPRARASVFRGRMEQGQVDGCNALLDCWDARFANGDLRWLAYCLATAYHETAQAMRPVREWGLGRGHAYGLPAGPWRQVYYGRGDVQETWEANYAHADARLHALGCLSADASLLRNPDLMLRPDIAAVTLFVGMAEGWFTGRKLADYFNAIGADWINARRIVNGLDCAAAIGAEAAQFHRALTP